jgi:hypothetical protein
MKKVVLPGVIIASVLSASAMAASINLRHEYMPDRDGDKHRDRITVAHRFDNGIGFSVEAKWKHVNDEIIKNMVSGGHEVGVSYNYKVNDRFTLQPAYAADVSSSSTTHKFNLRGITKITDGWGASLRYRYGLKSEPNKDNVGYHQFNLVTDYKLSWGKVGVDLEYKDLQSDQKGWRDNSHDHLVNFFGEYTQFESGWIPFVEVGFLTFDQNDNGTKDDYAMRYRVGVKYNF